jgi:GR25 family glycosyltransferase involved in LPS biosynthesis
MEKLLKLLNVSESDFSVIGINGTEAVNSDEFTKIMESTFLDRYSPGELGCALSHREAYVQIANSTFEHALIVEDDVKVSPLFLEKVKQYREFVLPSWKIIHWHTFCNDIVMSTFNCGGFIQNYTSIGRTQVAGHLYTSTMGKEYHGTVAYEINFRSASELLLKTTPVRCASDGPTAMFGKGRPFEDYVQTSLNLVKQENIGYSEINRLGGHHKKSK